MYKFLQSGYPTYFEPLLKPSLYNTCKNEADGVVPEVPHFASSVKFEQFGLTFAYNSPMNLNDTPGDIH